MMSPLSLCLRSPGESGTTVRGRIGDQGASRRMLATQRGRGHLLPMDLQLRGKRALVTGSTAGIGLAIAVDLGREGGEGVLNGRTREGGDRHIDPRPTG